MPEKPKNPYRILLVNFHSTMNAGDLALLITTRDFLLKIFPQSKFGCLQIGQMKPLIVSMDLKSSLHPGLFLVKFEILLQSKS